METLFRVCSWGLFAALLLAGSLPQEADVSVSAAQFQAALWLEISLCPAEMSRVVSRFCLC